MDLQAFRAAVFNSKTNYAGYVELGGDGNSVVKYGSSFFARHFGWYSTRSVDTNKNVRLALYNAIANNESYAGLQNEILRGIATRLGIVIGQDDQKTFSEEAEKPLSRRTLHTILDDVERYARNMASRKAFLTQLENEGYIATDELRELARNALGLNGKECREDFGVDAGPALMHDDIHNDVPPQANPIGQAHGGNSVIGGVKAESADKLQVRNMLVLTEMLGTTDFDIFIEKAELADYLRDVDKGDNDFEFGEMAAFRERFDNVTTKVEVIDLLKDITAFKVGKLQRSIVKNDSTKIDNISLGGLTRAIVDMAMSKRNVPLVMVPVDENDPNSRKVWRVMPEKVAKDKDADGTNSIHGYFKKLSTQYAELKKPLVDFFIRLNLDKNVTAMLWNRVVEDKPDFKDVEKLEQLVEASKVLKDVLPELVKKDFTPQGAKVAAEQIEPLMKKLGLENDDFLKGLFYELCSIICKDASDDRKFYAFVGKLQSDAEWTNSLLLIKEGKVENKIGFDLLPAQQKSNGMLSGNNDIVIEDDNAPKALFGQDHQEFDAEFNALKEHLNDVNILRRAFCMTEPLPIEKTAMPQDMIDFFQDKFGLSLKNHAFNDTAAVQKASENFRQEFLDRLVTDMNSCLAKIANNPQQIETAWNQYASDNHRGGFGIKASVKGKNVTLVPYNANPPEENEIAKQLKECFGADEKHGALASAILGDMLHQGFFVNFFMCLQMTREPAPIVSRVGSDLGTHLNAEVEYQEDGSYNIKLDFTLHARSMMIAGSTDFIETTRDSYLGGNFNIKLSFDDKNTPTLVLGDKMVLKSRLAKEVPLPREMFDVLNGIINGDPSLSGKDVPHYLDDLDSEDRELLKGQVDAYLQSGNDLELLAALKKTIKTKCILPEMEDCLVNIGMNRWLIPFLKTADLGRRFTRQMVDDIRNGNFVKKQKAVKDLQAICQALYDKGLVDQKLVVTAEDMQKQNI